MFLKSNTIILLQLIGNLTAFYHLFQTRSTNWAAQAMSTLITMLRSRCYVFKWNKMTLFRQFIGHVPASYHLFQTGSTNWAPQERIHSATTNTSTPSSPTGSSTRSWFWFVTQTGSRRSTMWMCSDGWRTTSSFRPLPEPSISSNLWTTLIASMKTAPSLRLDNVLLLWLLHFFKFLNLNRSKMNFSR